MEGNGRECHTIKEKDRQEMRTNGKKVNPTNNKKYCNRYNDLYLI